MGDVQPLSLKSKRRENFGPREKLQPGVRKQVTLRQCGAQRHWVKLGEKGDYHLTFLPRGP